MGGRVRGTGCDSIVNVGMGGTDLSFRARKLGRGSISVQAGMAARISFSPDQQAVEISVAAH